MVDKCKTGTRKNNLALPNHFVSFYMGCLPDPLPIPIFKRKMVWQCKTSGKSEKE